MNDRAIPAGVETPTISAELRFLAGGGEATRLILARDRAGHPLGPPAGWPQSSKTALSLLLPGGMNGRQMAEAGCGRRPALKVFFITGYADRAGGQRTARPRHGGADEAVPAECAAAAEPADDRRVMGRATRSSPRRTAPMSIDVLSRCAAGMSRGADDQPDFF